MSWLKAHAINPALARACGVTGELGGDIRFRCGVQYQRIRKPDGSMRQVPTGLGMRLYWPVGGDRNAHSVLLLEGEGDGLSAASVLCDSTGAPRENLPPPLAGLCPVVIPGTSTPPRVVCGELMAAGCSEVFICLDGDESGRLATSRYRAALGKLGIKVHAIWLPDNEDLAEHLVEKDDPTDFLATLIADSEVAYA